MSVFYRTVAVGDKKPVLINKTITANGSYNAASDSADGYDVVNVNVPVIGDITTVLVDWEQYSHVSEFDSITLPANYSDFEYIGLLVVQDVSNKNFYKGMSKAACKQFVDTNVNAWQILIIPTANISSSDTSITIPLMSADGYGHGPTTTTSAHINSSRILGYDYPWSWQDLYLLVLGFNS